MAENDNEPQGASVPLSEIVVACEKHGKTACIPFSEFSTEHQSWLRKPLAQKYVMLERHLGSPEETQQRKLRKEQGVSVHDWYREWRRDLNVCTI